MRKQLSFDEKCLDLARHFFPSQSIAFLEALAQEFQDCVEGRDDDADVKTLPIPDFLRNQENLRAERASEQAATLCDDCPPVGYPTDKTRCAECPRMETRVRCAKCGSGSDVYPHISCNQPGCPGANRGESR